MKWIIVSIIAIVLQQFMPWWSIAIAGFIFGYLIEQSLKMSFWMGFIGIFFLWGGIALYVHIVNDGILSGRLAVLTGLPHGLLMVLVTALLGGIIGGLASISGRYLRQIINWPKVEEMEY